MIFLMGCGGSRADAIIEPRYHESWTRETESTWLTNTDLDTPVSVPNGKPVEANREKRMVTTGIQCGKQALNTNGSSQQRRPRRSLSDQSTRDSKRRASKEATAVSKEGSEDPEPENVSDER